MTTDATEYVRPRSTMMELTPLLFMGAIILIIYMMLRVNQEPGFNTREECYEYLMETTDMITPKINAYCNDPANLGTR